jgi:NADH:ubiquinone oxidoreductase subunit E
MIIIHICIGSVCHINGSYNIIKKLQNLIRENNLEDKVEIKGAFCLGECTRPVSVKINEEAVISVNENNVIEFFEEYIVRRI